MKQLLFFVLTLTCSITAYSQTTTVSVNFECEVVLDIYNGLYDWQDNVSYSGGQLLESGKKYDIGARTVANKNDTDGDGLDDNSPSETSVTKNSKGRNEVDLMKLVVRKKSGNPSQVTLKKVSGDFQLWNSPTKGTKANFNSNNEIVILGNDLDKTFYIEALNESNSLQDIKIHLLDDTGATIDKVSATAIWCDIGNIYISNLSSPLAGQGALSDLDYSNLIKNVNITLRSANGQLYGFGDYRSNGSSTDQAIGGRMLFEFIVKPNGAGSLVTFDLTRQKEARRKALVNGGSSIVDLSSFTFPPDQNQDNEKPNDDTYSTTDEDNFPTNNKIYVEDPPGKPHDFSLFPDEFSFIMERVNFNDFVRVGIKGRPPIFDDQAQDVFGSRASSLKKWGVSFNFKRGTNKLLIDNDLSGVTAVRPAFGIAPAGNGTFTIATNGTTVSSSWSLTFSGMDNTWLLLDNELIFPGTIISITSPGTWSTTYNGMTISIVDGSTPFEDIDSVEFEVYRANSPKSSKIQESHINLNSF